jgi:hypothetical protein
MQSFMTYWHCVWPLSPGICVLFLGVEALAITLLPPESLQTLRVKIAAIVLCFLLAFGEISALRHDRPEAYDRHKEDMQEIVGRFTGLHQDVVALQSNLSATQQTRSLPADNLKRRAVDLSNEILRFLISREVPPEGYGQGGFGEGSVGGGKPSDIKAYDNETLSTFMNAFEPRVLAIHDEFKRKGLTNKEFEAEYAQPANRYSIRAIAEGIAALGSRLPD